MPEPIPPMIPLTDAQRTAVIAALRQRDLPPRLRERLEMVKAVAFGQEVEAIAAWSGRTPRTVCRWLDRFVQGGIPALADAPRSGRPPLADAGDHAALDAVTDTPPRLLGLPFDAWTSGRLSAYLAQTTGVRIAPGWVRMLLVQHRFRCGRPKHTLNYLRDAAAVMACEAAIAEAEKKGGGVPGAV